MNRHESAKLLVSEGAPAGVYDNAGNSALSLLIEKIPEVALEALDQFHSTDNINRKELYFLNYLEGKKLNDHKASARSPLEIAVQNERFDIILHPIMQRLITVKWQMYAKRSAVSDLVLNLLYTMIWTVIGVTIPRYGHELYFPLKDHIWRLVFAALVILLTLYEIKTQVQSKCPISLCVYTRKNAQPVVSCCAAPCEQCCAAPCEQCCVAPCEQCYVAPRE